MSTAQQVVDVCTRPSIGSIFCGLFCVAIFALMGSGTGKKNNGSTPGTGLFLYFLAACYCLSTLSTVYNYFTTKPCDKTGPAAPSQ